MEIDSEVFFHIRFFWRWQTRCWTIFIDETKINVREAWLWVAYEPQLKAFLMKLIW